MPEYDARCQMVQIAAAEMLGCTLAGRLPTRGLLLAAQGATSSWAAAAPLEPLNRFPRMVQEYFVARVREAERGRDAKAARRPRPTPRSTSRRSARRFADCFGPFPEKTPLNAARHRRGRARRLHDREGDLREPARVPRDRPISTCPRAGSSRCPAWSAPAAIRPTARRSRPTSRSPRGWPAWATWC